MPCSGKKEGGKTMAARGFKAWGLAAVLAAAVLVQSASAQLLIDPSGKAEVGQIEVAASLILNEIEYEIANSAESDIEYTVIGAQAAYALNEMVDVFGALGFIAKAESDTDDGDGFMLAGGVRAAVATMNAVAISAYAQVQYLSEDFDNDVEATVKELLLGVTGSYMLNDIVKLYGGLELVPYSDGEVETPRGDADVERDAMFTVRVGGTADVSGVLVRAELSLLAEQGITLGLGTRF
jgi:hypothetical protein